MKARGDGELPPREAATSELPVPATLPEEHIARRTAAEDVGIKLDLINGKFSTNMPFFLSPSFLVAESCSGIITK